jgi:Transglycosylase SLT domain
VNAEARSIAAPGLLVLGGSAAMTLPLLGVVILLVLGHATGVGLGGHEAQTYRTPSAGPADIPSAYLRLYMAAARRYGLDWAVLAAVGKVECDHGRDPGPSCTRPGAVNRAGAGGPAQFLAGTWRAFGVDGDNDGVANRWDPADAIFSMANYLRASRAPKNYRRALFAYNHSWSYVAEVEHWAAVYGADATASAQVSWSANGGLASSVRSTGLIPGSRAMLTPRDGHIALIPADVPLVVQAMLIAGNELQVLPYGAGGHPDPRGASSEDCSSTLNYVLYRSGVRPIDEILRENPLAQAYTRWGAPGPGHWVTIYATAAPVPHVFAVIAGLRLDTSHDGTDMGPNRFQDGPRWRVLDHIPTWAHWTVRHPPGL